MLENLAAETGFHLEESLDAVLVEIQTEFSRLNFQIRGHSHNGTNLTTKSVYRHSLRVWLGASFQLAAEVQFFVGLAILALQHSNASDYGELLRDGGDDGAWALRLCGHVCDEFCYVYVAF